MLVDGDGRKEAQKTPQDAYCETCKATLKRDCATCKPFARTVGEKATNG